MHRWSRTFDLFGREKLLLDVRKSTSRIDTRQSSDNTPRYVLLRMLPLEFLHGFKCFSIDGTMRQRTKIVSHTLHPRHFRRFDAHPLSNLSRTWIGPIEIPYLLCHLQPLPPSLLPRLPIFPLFYQSVDLFNEFPFPRLPTIDDFDGVSVCE